MELTKTQKYTIGGVVLLGITAISTYLYNQFNKIYNASWTYAGAKNIKLGFDKITFTVFFAVDNKGDLSVDISEQNYTVFLNGKPISAIINKPNVVIASNAKSKIPFYISITPKDALKAGATNLADLIGDKSRVKIAIVGNLDIKAGIVKLKKYPFALNYTLAEILGDEPSPTGDVNNA